MYHTFSICSRLGFAGSLFLPCRRCARMTARAQTSPYLYIYIISKKKRMSSAEN